ncbi:MULTISPECIES: PTS sugar transporter subunit IIB [unclassified Frigoribacterium]|jgi:PTS system ascorbate-specific IIB component|uniref:PTS sugar transporter subunit IIB n=1 Tax=unclassified Frigoribacterium TaxID=2627005 RepID=UPI000F46569C|nr:MULTISPECIES: PTS sugar transporter subunit IIB [unclassified Frigoribacterium]MBD8585727.1 PTS sugar transporter subunit IIB [Frigoribacterium sp. CFBP 8766]MBD8611499.1 PTS sugar transporter subunit IIB [Frigoribacterium sp. CFBP 13729]ROP73376.1 PTS system IIB component (L-Asc family) [Frigoribacterium sp. PhB107]TDT63232.1 PTS system IIB component (L-Asc family) [Frigoribacterium sp. PhB116]
MKIITVCGMGIGTSVLLKMNAEKALRALDIDADVEAADIGTARGAARTAELVLTSEDLVEELGQVPAKVVVIDNFTNVAEIQQKIQDSIA